MKHIILPILALSLAACAPMPRANPLSRAQADALTLSAIEVTTTGAAFENQRAADFSTRLDPDLTATLQRDFADRLKPSGAILTVDVARLNVADSGRTAFGWDQSKLIGQARLTDATGAVLATYPIQVNAGQAAKTRTGALVSAAIGSSEKNYLKLIKTFSENLLEQIED
ncbi:hypothetical protein EDD53_1660 [Pacificibacter maritimus]|uniref:Lipoprotein n=1 Tax=Pacificibacter maritimus TaxID=762213 RepID=A0A3N4UFL6_9RHOB|nr:hypothetical protein [Pacificibacter maritimus]RPE67255.1 hypothetical protein EDD53_1660 [Pacificibacter maritimus]